MIRWLVPILVLAGCANEVRLPAKAPPFQNCQAMPRPLPRIREPEAVNERLDRMEALYRDCAARLRMTVAAWPKETK